MKNVQMAKLNFGGGGKNYQLKLVIDETRNNS